MTPIAQFPEQEEIQPPDPEQELQLQAEQELAQSDLELDFPEDMIQSLRTIVDSLEKPEEPNRIVILRECKKLLSYWVGIQRIWWDASRQDYRFINDTDEDSSTTMDFREDTINIYRPYGEAIVAALGASIPKLLWAPADADNPDDILKSKAYGKITEYLEIVNNLPLKTLRILYTLWNQHFCATYIYADTNAKYGSVLFPKYVEKSKIVRHTYCPECMSEMDEPEEIDNPEEAGEFGPDLSATGLGLTQCPNCGSFVSPETDEETVNYEEFDKYEASHKSKICIDVFGPLNVKIPLICKDEEKLPYLIFEEEVNVNVAREMYPHCADRIQPQTGEESFDRWARTTIDYNYAYPTQACTIRKIWLTPASYNVLLQEKVKQLKLKKLFPEGCCVTFIGNLFVEAYESKLTDCWTISRNPVSEYLHGMPLGRQATSVQEIQTELLDLSLATIEQGISETFADPSVIDFEKYKTVRKEPGLMFPIKKKPPDQNLSNSFFETRSATLSKEVPELQNRLDQMGQFATSALPSVWGGQQKGGSGTLGEYEQSRAQALQRLGIVWKIINDLYARTMDKATQMFEQHMLEDEKFARQQGNGWLNIYIKKSEMSGNLGRVISQSAEQFPVSWDQKTARMFELLQMQDPNIQQILYHPDNAFFFARCIGLPELFIPGDAQRNKQLVEIGQLITTSDQMQPGVDPLGQPMLVSSVPIEPSIDDDQVHIAVCQAWLISEVGQMYKENDPMAYQNVMAHMQMHIDNMNQKLAQQAAQVQPVAEAGQES